MAQKRKTPKHLIDTINRYHDYVEYCEERIRVKTTVPVENQADHIQKITVEEIVGQATGAWVMLEAALMAYGCYAGYMNLGYERVMGGGKGRTSVTTTDPEYRDWFRHYYTRT